MSDTPPEEPKMEKPRHRRDWRGILTELLIVVLGVGLALAAQQAAEWLNWRNQVAQAREIIATEMTRNVQSTIIRIRAEPCIERRLDELALILDEAGKSGRLPPVGDIGLPPRGAWLSGAWESVVASQTATHFPPQQLADISRAYRTIELLGQVYNIETEDWHDLYAMVGPGRRLDPASEADLRKALSRARSSTRSLASLSAVNISRIRNLNLSFTPEDLAGIADVRTVPLTGGKVTFNAANSTSAICGPIGAVPATYGQGQFSFLPAMQDDMMKAIADFSGGAK